MMEHIIGHKALRGRHRMKKILLIIAITLLMFQMIVLAVDIDIGSAAIDRPSDISASYTIIAKDNPANDSGVITQIEIWVYINSSDVEIATFYETATNQFSTRDTHYIGSVVAGAKRTFTGLSLEVQSGDYIGFHGASVELDTSTGPGWWWKSGDYIPCTTTTFGYETSRIVSLYGTGTTEVGEEGAIFFGTNF